ncbi:MAG: hypothetical protein AAF752_08790 [Bacteroidota bacterium]
MPAVVVPGYGVASGQADDARFPQGTIRMQIPLFQEFGLDLSRFYPGTLNCSVAPYQYEIVEPKVTFRGVKWHPELPAEDFSFFDCRLYLAGGVLLEALVYRPHPDTKPDHVQPSDVLELLAPYTAGLLPGTAFELEADGIQFVL